MLLEDEGAAAKTLIPRILNLREYLTAPSPIDLAMVQFILVNGYGLAIDDSVRWAEAIIALVEHPMTEEEFGGEIRPFVVER